MPHPLSPSPHARRGGTTSRASKPSARTIASFRRRLLRWFAQHRRDLPWRRTRDPYHVAVSEFMLQQTHVTRVLEYYPRFLARFPTIDSLAAARPKAVREAWDGLGYYARARNLQALAREVVRRPDATLPPEPAELVKLPGVGRYTAGAIATFAYEKPVAAVDTNVGRVIARYFLGSQKPGAFGSGEPGAGSRSLRGPSGSRPPAPGSREIWRLAEALVPRNGRRAWDFNQGLMELGALVCTSRRPKCGECPVRKGCKTGGRVVPG